MAARQTPLRLAAPLGTDPAEDEHQETLFRTVALHVAEVPELAGLYHVPNGGKRDIRTAMALQRRGVKPGIPDCQLDVARHGYHGLRLELKRFRNGSIEDEQEKRLAQLAKDGYRAIVCWGWIAAWEEILWYLSREDLLVPTGYRSTQLIKTFPEHPFWQRRKPNVRVIQAREAKPEVLPVAKPKRKAPRSQGSLSL